MSADLVKSKLGDDFSQVLYKGKVPSRRLVPHVHFCQDKIGSFGLEKQWTLVKDGEQSGSVYSLKLL